MSSNRKQQEPEQVSSIEDGDMARPTATFLLVDIKDYFIAEKTKHYFQVNHVIKKLRTKNPKGENNLQKKDSINWLT